MTSAQNWPLKQKYAPDITPIITIVWVILCSVLLRQNQRYILDRVICFWQGIVMHWKLNTRAPNDVFLLNTLKSLFRLSRVLLDLDRCILGDARTSVLFSPKFKMQFNELRKWEFFQSSLHRIFESENLYEKQPHLGSESCQMWKIRIQKIVGNLLHKLRKLYMDGMVM